jgi:ArsR family transcriptional regulator
MLTILKALNDPTRLRILHILARGEFTVQELTAILAMGQSRVSRHLKILLEAHILSVKREGTWAYYQLRCENAFFAELWPALEKRLGREPGCTEDGSRLLETLARRRRRSLEFFDRHALQWDALARDVLPTAEYRSLLLREVAPSASLLEVGVGTGNLLLGLRDRARQVIGVDNSRVMLEQAEARLARFDVKGVELRLGEMQHLPVGDGEVQWAVLNMVLHHAAQPRVVFRELARVVASGGGLTLADLQRHEKEWVRDRLADQWLGFEEEELIGWLKAAGFAPLRLHKVAGRTAEQHGVFVLSARRF